MGTDLKNKCSNPVVSGFQVGKSADYTLACVMGSEHESLSRWSPCEVIVCMGFVLSNEVMRS